MFDNGDACVVGCAARVDNEPHKIHGKPHQGKSRGVERACRSVVPRVQVQPLASRPVDVAT